MKRFWFSITGLLLIGGLSACAVAPATPAAVILTPEPSQSVSTLAATLPRQLEIITPTAGNGQPPVDSPTRLPPLEPGDMTVDSWFSISPDGKWTAQVQVAFPFDKNGVSTGNRYYVRLEVLKHDGSQHWLVLDRWADWGLGYTVPANLHWRNDSQRLYFSNEATADGCAVFGNKRGLFEVNLENGKVVELSNNTFGELQAAPDGLRIAILSEKVLSVRTLASGKTVETNLNFLRGDWQAGNLLWSPDEKNIAFTVLYKPCGPPESSSIYRMNASTGEITSLITLDKRVFVASQWLADGRIELIDQVGAKYHFDPVKKTIDPVK